MFKISWLLTLAFIAICLISCKLVLAENHTVAVEISCSDSTIVLKPDQITSRALTARLVSGGPDASIENQYGEPAWTFNASEGTCVGMPSNPSATWYNPAYEPSIRSVTITASYHFSDGQGNVWNGTSDPITFTIYVIRLSVAGNDRILDGVTTNTDYNAQVEPAGIPVSAYMWSWDIEPTSYGNNPQLSFSSSTSSTTKINSKAWWYAAPDDRLYASLLSSYRIHCKIMVAGCSIKDDDSGVYSVITPGIAAETKGTMEGGIVPTIIVENGIDIYTVNIGDWRKGKPVIHYYIDEHSQFIKKTTIHENVHVKQLETGLLKDIYDANLLYSMFFNNIGSADDTIAINQIDDARLNAANWIQMMLIELAPFAEYEAYPVSNQISPHYIYER